MANADTFYKNLKIHRENQGISLTEISERTKINERYFESIENGQFTVLPTVYMRLFLRSYCIEIGADPDQALKDYESYTTGKVTQKPELKFKPVEEDGNTGDSKSDTIDFGNSISRKNIIYFIIGIIIIFSLVKFVSYLSHEAEGSNPITLNEADLDTNTVTESRAIPGEDQTFSILPKPSQLEEYFVYNTRKLVQQKAYRMSVRPPFKMTISAYARTKVHITSQGNNLFDGILNVHDTRSFTDLNTIKFDFWSAQHIRADINGADLIPYLPTLDRAIRGSLDSDGSLSIQIFSH